MVYSRHTHFRKALLPGASPRSPCERSPRERGSYVGALHATGFLHRPFSPPVLHHDRRPYRFRSGRQCGALQAMRWADDSVPRVLWAGALDGVAMPSLRNRYASEMATGRKEFKGRLTKALALTHK